jgi:hypothetical protein
MKVGWFFIIQEATQELKISLQIKSETVKDPQPPVFAVGQNLKLLTKAAKD